MKIAVFIPSLLSGKGGAERIAAQVASLLAGQGASVHVLCTPKDGGPSYSLPEDIVIHRVGFGDEEKLAMLRTQNYNLMIAFGMGQFFTPLPKLAAYMGTPFVIQECTNPFRMTKILESYTTNGTSANEIRQAVFAHAAAVRFTVPEYCDSVCEEVRPFAYGFYNAIVTPAADQERLSRKIICVGSMKDENKNGLAAVQAFAEVSAIFSAEWCLHLYGRNRFEQGVDFIKAQYPWAKIVDYGMVDRVQDIYGDAYALVIPSFEEGLPNAVIEAFSYGIPCIGFSDCPGVRELIRHGETGVLADRGKPGSLSEALRKIILLPELRDRMSANARRFSVENLHFYLWKRRWLDLVENAANGRDAAGMARTPAAFVPDDPRAAHWRGIINALPVGRAPAAS